MIPGVVAAALLAVASLLPASAAPILRHGCDASPQELKTFRVETEWARTSYAHGQTAKIKVTVTRPGPKDPLNQGLDTPDVTRQPVEGAAVSLAVFNAFPYVATGGETDKDGVVLLKLEVVDHLRGWQDTFTDAKIYYKTLPAGPDCTDVVERGFKAELKAFKVKG